ncbi:hypothetical protein EBN88_08620 [Streptomyces triticirhizae]|uniref:Uncharacterized protein n=2 Tax=Streptomyces triticirhizae TaxID=2483353 RepID=A0A3M2LZ76_9ACTN|nr:hypothetical protein EBN88_08620 [Streptomyces triticirhizae]
MVNSARHRLDALLSEWSSFEECLLHDVRPVHFGFGVRMDINHVWGPDGQVRPDALERPVLVRLFLMGVQRLEFTGALNHAQLADPEQLDWGLTEIAVVRRFDVPDLVGLAVEWESERQLRVCFADFLLSVPDA